VNNFYLQTNLEKVSSDHITEHWYWSSLVMVYIKNEADVLACHRVCKQTNLRLLQWQQNEARPAAVPDWSTHISCINDQQRNPNSSLSVCTKEMESVQCISWLDAWGVCDSCHRRQRCATVAVSAWHSATQ